MGFLRPNHFRDLYGCRQAPAPQQFGFLLSVGDFFSGTINCVYEVVVRWYATGRIRPSAPWVDISSGPDGHGKLLKMAEAINCSFVL